MINEEKLGQITGYLNSFGEFEGFDFDGGDLNSVWEDNFFLGVKRLSEELNEKTRKIAFLENKQKQLEESVLSLKNFAGTVSHDLKSPVDSLKSLVELIKKQKLKDDSVDIGVYLELFDKLILRMCFLINGILKNTSIENSVKEKEEIDLHLEIMQFVELAVPFHNIEIKVVDQLPFVNFNRTEIIQIFQNLISNAIKYNGKPDCLIEIGHKEHQKCHEFYVKDNGTGIKESMREEIFNHNKFSSGKRSYESSGIGLQIVKKIIDSWGGSIRVESEVGEGAKFIFTLPRF